MPAYHYNRVFLIVMDSVGIGEAPDAEKFNDKGADTLGHIAEHMGASACRTWRSSGSATSVKSKECKRQTSRLPIMAK